MNILLPTRNLEVPTTNTTLLVGLMMLVPSLGSQYGKHDGCDKSHRAKCMRPIWCIGILEKLSHNMKVAINRGQNIRPKYYNPYSGD